MKLNTEVSGIEKENDTYKIETNNGVIEANTFAMQQVFSQTKLMRCVMKRHLRLH